MPQLHPYFRLQTGRFCPTQRARSRPVRDSVGHRAVPWVDLKLDFRSGLGLRLGLGLGLGLGIGLGNRWIPALQEYTAFNAMRTCNVVQHP